MQLASSILNVPLVGQKYAQKLARLEIGSVADLFHHIPFRYEDFRNIKKIKDVKPNEVVTIVGEIEDFQNRYTKSRKVIQTATIDDGTGRLFGIWFNQSYLRNVLTVGAKISLSGKVSFYGNKLSIYSPKYEILKPALENIHTGKLVGVYPETHGVTSKWLRRRIKEVLSKTTISEFLPGEILEEEKLIEFNAALSKIHFPENESDIRQAYKRLSFNEFLKLHLENQIRKRAKEKEKSAYKVAKKEKEINQFIASLPFKLTGAQKRATAEILADLAKATPMTRLLEGDVGSGKTIVSAIAMYTTYLNGFQSILLAPTQILANQHFNSLKKLFNGKNIKVSLLTGTTKKGDLGGADILVGTHSLLNKKNGFRDLALVIVDEEQRFGVTQRNNLLEPTTSSGGVPHFLSVTATPIPRSIAHTYFGEMALSTIDEMPKGRILPKTWVVPTGKRSAGEKWIRDKITTEKIQAFVVCPLIEDSKDESLASVKAVKSEYERLKKVFKGLKLGLLHGKLTEKEKKEVMHKFKKGEIDILVSTLVIEVGIDVPNANIMVVEGADRFGLSQLHQLRGRIGRGDKESYCLLFTDNDSEKVKTRLNALKTAKTGFELSEMDLSLRGPGEVFGTRQSGLSGLKIASWRDIKLIKKSKAVALKFLARPEKYSKAFAFFGIKL